MNIFNTTIPFQIIITSPPEYTKSLPTQTSKISSRKISISPFCLLRGITLTSIQEKILHNYKKIYGTNCMSCRYRKVRVSFHGENWSNISWILKEYEKKLIFIFHSKSTGEEISVAPEGDFTFGYDGKNILLLYIQKHNCRQVINELIEFSRTSIGKEKNDGKERSVKPKEKTIEDRSSSNSLTNFKKPSFPFTFVPESDESPATSTQRLFKRTAARDPFVPKKSGDK
jgi:hypothetical protein